MSHEGGNCRTKVKKNSNFNRKKNQIVSRKKGVEDGKTHLCNVSERGGGKQAIGGKKLEPKGGNEL